jgi:hypothetical protein
MLDYYLLTYSENAQKMGQYAGERGQAEVLVKHSVENLVTLSLLKVLVNPILHTAWLDNHALTLKSTVILQNIIFMKNPHFCIPS